MFMSCLWSLMSAAVPTCARCSWVLTFSSMVWGHGSVPTPPWIRPEYKRVSRFWAYGEFVVVVSDADWSGLSWPDGRLTILPLLLLLWQTTMFGTDSRWENHVIGRAGFTDAVAIWTNKQTKKHTHTRTHRISSRVVDMMHLCASD